MILFNMIIFISMIFSIFVGGCLILSMGKYRYVYHFKDGTRSGAGWQETPWKFLALYRVRNHIKNDSTIYKAYIENISEQYWNRDTSSGKIVWEWNKDVQNV